jgi:CO dehydrogenase maturation factor
MMQTIAGKRILVCGKGGSGKSAVVAMMAVVLEQKGYETLVLDGDASNPEGLIRLLFGSGVESEPRPLIDFFGGIERVTCPVDDPAALTRIGESVPLSEKRIDMAGEVPQEYYIDSGGIRLLQAGKIEHYGQGCDGPVEKVVRDFMVEGEWVSLIDMKAGVEHFGRKIPDTMDMLLVVLDPTLESVSIARKVEAFCEETGLKHWGVLLNKIGSKEMEAIMMEKLGELSGRVIGVIPYDHEVAKSALEGRIPVSCRAMEALTKISERLEKGI